MSLPLQDTNDHFLANLQKDGTYFDCAAGAGRRDHAEKLIVLGVVAKKFGLYTKITGAQRIDLFGARVEQLPLVWKELVGRRFRVGPRLWEGIANGKVLRRQHLRWPLRSPGLGRDGWRIDIENRYRGIRSPQQDEDGGLGLHARVRRGPREGRGHHRHRERLESVRVRERRHEAAPRGPSRHGPSTTGLSSST